MLISDNSPIRKSCFSNIRQNANVRILQRFQTYSFEESNVHGAERKQRDSHGAACIRSMGKNVNVMLESMISYNQISVITNHNLRYRKKTQIVRRQKNYD